MKVAFIFPGQGSQKVGMGKEFYDNFSVSKNILELSSEAVDIDFSKIIFEDNDKINISEFTQPAILINSIMALKAFEKSIDIKPTIVLGHSLGEFSALISAGSLDFDKAVKLVKLRGRLMQKACIGKDVAMMVVLGLDDNIVESICKNAINKGAMAYPANYNCDGQIVVAGIRDDLLNLESEFKLAGARRTMLLNMSVISHCPMLSSVTDELKSELQDKLNDAIIPIVSNVTANTYKEKSLALQLLKDQLISPVLYKQSIINFEDSVDVFIEFGSSILSGLNKKITSKPTFSITDIESLNNTVKKLEEI